MKFKKGDKVRIKDSSDFAIYQQRQLDIGEVIDIDEISIIVRSTTNDYENTYGEYDLEFAEIVEQHKVDDKLEVIINEKLVAITDSDGDMIEVTMDQLEQVYMKCFGENAKVYKQELPISYGYDCQCEFCKTHTCVLNEGENSCTHFECESH